MTETEMDRPGPTGPYAAQALNYHRAGWSPLPLPPNSKAPVPQGWTGSRGATPSGADVYAWTEEHPQGNVAIRLPADVIGIDVDHYDGKIGGVTLAALEQSLGALPRTWRDSSRDDGVSGIRLYRVTPGLRWPGGLGDGIDTIRWDHRYAVVWPSVHPSGGVYRWITPDGLVALGAIPNPTDLPDLPEAWIQHFTKNELSSEQPHAGFGSAAAVQWVETYGRGEPCSHMDSATSRGITELTGGHESGRHDSALAATNRVLWLAGEGHPGAMRALETLGRAFLVSVSDGRRPGDPEGEWQRMIMGAVDIAAGAHPTPSGVDPCSDPFRGLLDADGWAAEAARLAARASHASREERESSEATEATPPNTPTQSRASHDSRASRESREASEANGDAASPAGPNDPWYTPLSHTYSDASAYSWEAWEAREANPQRVHAWGDVDALVAPPSTSGTGATDDPSRSYHPGPLTASALDPATSADDATELQIKRNQAAAIEAERLRAQQRARRMVAQEDMDGQVEDAVTRKVIADAASARYRELTMGPPRELDAGTLDEILARPPEEEMRVRGLIPWAGSTLVVAMRKTGKTTLLLNYAKSLTTGEPFLGDFDVVPLAHDQRVAFLNYEVSARQIARWAHETGIPGDRLVIVNLRGEPNPLATPEGMTRLAEYLTPYNIGAIIVDPFGRAYYGTDQNANGEVQQFLITLDEFARVQVGCEDVVLATHAGWDGERTRGASALEDWPDTIITMTMDKEGQRFLKAQGRDVDIEEDALTLLTDGRTLVRTNTGSRETQKKRRDTAAVAVLVARHVAARPGLTTKDLLEAIITDGDYEGAPRLGMAGRARTTLDKAIEMANVHIVKELGKANTHYPDTLTDPYRTPTGKGPNPPLPPPSFTGGGVGVGGIAGEPATPTGGRGKGEAHGGMPLCNPDARQRWDKHSAEWVCSECGVIW